jgi:hypothetical protein
MIAKGFAPYEVQKPSRSWKSHGNAASPSALGGNRHFQAKGVRSNGVRDWAKTNGVEIRERGRVPVEVVTKFLTATGQ